MLKITFLQSSLWLSGGARVVVEYANRLRERHHIVRIVIPKNTLSDELACEISSSVEVLEARLPLIKPMNLWENFRLMWAMVKTVPPSDVIIATHTPTTTVSLLAGKLLGRGTPLWFYMDYPGMFVDRPAERWLLRNAMRWHKAAFVLSSHSAQELSTFSTRECIFVGLGLSHYEILKPRLQNQSETQGRKKIMYLGDFRLRKGFRDFLDATEIVFRDMPEIELWIVMKEKGDFHTPVPFRLFYRPAVEQLAELYASCDVFVSATWFEGFGLPSLEAMACGAPVVMTDSGGINDYAHSGENCLIVDAQKPAELAAAIQQILSNPELAKKMRQVGPITASEFTWEKATDRFEAALLKLVS